MSKAAGDRAELQVLAAAERYRATGEAMVFKRPTPARALSRPDAGGRFLAVWTEQAGCDFAGVLADGRALVVELKTASTPRLPLMRHGKPTLKPGQEMELKAAHALGGWAGVLVEIEARPGPGVAWYLLSWPAWQAAVAEALDAGAASLNHSTLDVHGQLVDPADWLRPVLGG